MRNRRAVGALAAFAAVGLALTACSSGSGDNSGDKGDGGETTLTLASWRTEDTAIWNDTIIPAFNKKYPNIKIKYSATKSSEYTSSQTAALQGGTGADLLMCQPFAPTWTWAAKSYLEPLDGLDASKKFTDQSFQAWSSNGKKYCLPMAAVQANFFYNKKIFSELGLSVPKTHQEFIDLLKKVKENGKYEPLAYGTADAWVPQVLGYDLIGPNYFKGEEGRLALVDGKAQFNDAPYVGGIQAMGDWRPYLPKGASSLTFDDQGQLFAMGKAAVWPTGSFAINTATSQGADVGVFAPPVPQDGDGYYIQLHPDQAIGINANSKHKDAAKKFIDWLASDDFTSMYANALPGFFSLRKNPSDVQNPLVQAMVDIQKGAKGTVQRLSIGEITAGGTPPLESVIAASLQSYLNDTNMTAQQVADKWEGIFKDTYKPKG